jgi:hypothetical protein
MIESDRKAKMPSILGNRNEIMKTIIAGSIENSL